MGPAGAMSWWLASATKRRAAVRRRAPRTPGHLRSNRCLDRLDGHVRRPRGGQNARLPGCQSSERRLHVCDLVLWNHNRAMTIGVNEITIRRGHTVDVHAAPKVDNVHVSVRGADRTRQHLEPFGDHRQVANTAVGDGPQTAKRLVDGRLDFPPKRSVSDVFAVKSLAPHAPGT